MSTDQTPALARAAETLTTIEVSRPGDPYGLFTSGHDLDVHLAGRGEHGGTGPCLCGFDRFARGADGRWIVGFSVGGGVTGPNYRHHVCAVCARLAGDRPIGGAQADAVRAAILGADQ